MTERGEIYRKLGVEPIINATATVTILGGSLMRPETLDAMREAAECFVDMTELGAAVGRRIADLTHNEAAFVCGGAAAGLFLTTASCMTRGVPDGILRLSDVPNLPNEVIIHRAHRIPYDQAIGLTGARLVEIGGPEGTTTSELDAAINNRTAMVIYIAGAHLAKGALPLEDVLRVAHRRGIPVVVDAAAQIPPVDNLWRFTQAGAELAIFSGGKGLRAPASTGLVLGRPDAIARCAANAAPLQRLGRPMKVGKEDLVGILRALELYLAEDHEATDRFYEAVVAHFVAWGRERSDVSVVREFPSEAGQPMPRARITLHGKLADRRDEVIRELYTTRPRIGLWPAGTDGLYINPQTMLPGEEMIVSRRLDEVLAEWR